MAFLAMKKMDGSTVERWEIPERPATFGRSEQADFRISDDRLSRQHFTIMPKDGKYILQDLKSTNGTWVNGQRITEVTLQPNDKIRAGQTVLVFELEKPKGLGTVIGELEKEKKGFSTLMGEISEEAK